MLEPSALDSEMSRLRQRLLSTEDALRNALEHNQQVDRLVQAMRRHPEKSPVGPGPGRGGLNPRDANVLAPVILRRFEQLAAEC